MLRLLEGWKTKTTGLTESKESPCPKTPDAASAVNHTQHKPLLMLMTTLDLCTFQFTTWPNASGELETGWTQSQRFSDEENENQREEEPSTVSRRYSQGPQSCGRTFHNVVCKIVLPTSQNSLTSQQLTQITRWADYWNRQNSPET